MKWLIWMAQDIPKIGEAPINGSMIAWIAGFLLILVSLILGYVFKAVLPNKEAQINTLLASHDARVAKLLQDAQTERTSMLAECRQERIDQYQKFEATLNLILTHSAESMAAFQKEFRNEIDTLKAALGVLSSAIQGLKHV